MIKKNIPFQFKIGEAAWEKEIRYFTTELIPDYWAGFRSVNSEEITKIEQETRRRLPEDFKEFLRVFGCGHFPLKYGGDISDPENLIDCCHGHLWMILGSGDWASAEEQRRFYVTRGAFNPAPAKYTADGLKFENLNLLNLFQIGSNGMCCYHQLYVGEASNPLGYCLLTPEQTIEDECQSFSEGLKKILAHHWLWDEPPEDENGGSNFPAFEPL